MPYTPRTEIECAAIINPDGRGPCIAFAYSDENTTEIGIYRTYTGYEVIHAELSGEDDEPYELSRDHFAKQSEAFRRFAEITAAQLA